MTGPCRFPRRRARGRPRRFGAAALACALAIGGCDMGEGGSDGGLLRVALVDGGGGTDDPTASSGAAMAAGAVRAGLLRFDARGEIAPALARSWNVSPDGLQYVFRLRRDARWSDGKPVTADSVARMLTRMLGKPAPGTPARLAPEFERAAAPSPDVVEISLSRRAPALLSWLAHPAFALADRKRFAAGPFLPDATAKPAAPVTLPANPAYFDARAVAPGRVRLERATGAAAVRLFRDGRADVVTGGTLAGLMAAREAGGRQGAFRVEPAIGLIALDFGEDAGVLTDDRMRLALSLAIDRAGLAQSLFATPGLGGTYALRPAIARAAAQTVPDWADEPMDARSAAAAAIALEAGVSPGQPITLTVETVHGSEPMAVLRALSAAWAPLGVTLRARTRSAADHARFVARGAFQIALIERIAPVPSDAWFLDRLRCGAVQAWRCSPEADAAIDRATASGGPAEQARAEWLLQARTPVIPLFNAVRWSLVAPAVNGWVDNAQGAHPLSALRVGGREPAR